MPLRHYNHIETQSRLALPIADHKPLVISHGKLVGLDQPNLCLGRWNSIIVQYYTVSQGGFDLAC